MSSDSGCWKREQRWRWTDSEVPTQTTGAEGPPQAVPLPEKPLGKLRRARPTYAKDEPDNQLRDRWQRIVRERPPVWDAAKEETRSPRRLQCFGVAAKTREE
jgi:hypothetical protein